jgi:hypothetical protein
MIGKISNASVNEAERIVRPAVMSPAMRTKIVKPSIP